MDIFLEELAAGLPDAALTIRILMRIVMAALVGTKSG
jgi:hypothetical protein